MYQKRRSWEGFGLALCGAGIGPIWCAFAVASVATFQQFIVIFLMGFVFLAAGIAVLIWDWKRRKRYTRYRIDKKLNYVFTLITDEGTEIVTDYSQIEKALKRLGRTKQGVVEVRIEPPMAKISVVDCSYKDGYFYTYFQQEREDGKGYWLSICEKTEHADNNLWRLYVRRTKIDFDNMNCKKTGEGR